MLKETEITVGSKNVFADLGLLSPEEELLKADLVYEIYHVVTDRHFTSFQLAHILQVDETLANQLANAEPVNCSSVCLEQYLEHLKNISSISHNENRIAA